MPTPALWQQIQLGALAQQSPGILGSVDRDPNYDYGNILPFRKPVAGGPAQWGLGYSNLAKGLYDAFTAPKRAYQGDPITPEDAMNFAMTMGGGGMALGRAPAGSLGMNVYHGSPYKFDKFDLSKVGNGEGAQAYGHGLYFAEKPEVAQSYAAMPSGKVAHRVTGEVLDSRAVPIEKMRDYGAPPQNLYKVDLPDEHIAKMLDWDKPLSQDHPARKLLADRASQMMQVHEYGAGRNAAKDALIAANNAELTGSGLYRQLENLGTKYALDGTTYTPAADVSELLRSIGVPGIKYLDQGSRAGGQGTSNFVVFDDALPKIIGRE